MIIVLLLLICWNAFGARGKGLAINDVLPAAYDDQKQKDQLITPFIYWWQLISSSFPHSHLLAHSKFFVQEEIWVMNDSRLPVDRPLCMQMLRKCSKHLQVVMIPAYSRAGYKKEELYQTDKRSNIARSSYSSRLHYKSTAHVQSPQDSLMYSTSAADSIAQSLLKRSLGNLLLF